MTQLGTKNYRIKSSTISYYLILSKSASFLWRTDRSQGALTLALGSPRSSRKHLLSHSTVSPRRHWLLPRLSLEVYALTAITFLSPASLTLGPPLRCLAFPTKTKCFRPHIQVNIPLVPWGRTECILFYYTSFFVSTPPQSFKLT